GQADIDQSLLAVLGSKRIDKQHQAADSHDAQLGKNGQWVDEGVLYHVAVILAPLNGATAVGIDCWPRAIVSKRCATLSCIGARNRFGNTPIQKTRITSGTSVAISHQLRSGSLAVFGLGTPNATRWTIQSR